MPFFSFQYFFISCIWFMRYRKSLLLIVLGLFCLTSYCSVEQDSLVLIKKLNQATNPQQKIQANIALAKFFLARSLSRAQGFVNSAKALSKSSNTNEGLADVFCVEGEINYLLANYVLSKSNYTEALSLCNKETQQLTMGDAYSGLGKT